MWVGVVWWQWTKGKSWRWLGFVHTAVTFWCVVVTGNHFVLDAIFGWMLALGALALAGRLTRRLDVPRAQWEHGSSSRIPVTSATSQ